jgi:hypothetical protein
LEAWNSPSDQVSRVWATNVNATTASAVDTVGIFTVIQLSPIPSLQSQFFPIYEGSLTNIIKVSWPTEPTNFVLQGTGHLGPSTLWQAATTPRVFSDGTVSWIELPAASASPSGFFHLVWPNGQGQVQPLLSTPTNQRSSTSPLSP